LRDELKTILVTAGVIIEKKKVLVTQRMEGAPRGLLWEFPGGKVKEGEDPRKALQRELKEELDIDVEVGKILEAVFHTYPEYPILLLTYRCRIKKGVPKPIGCHDLRWVGLEELNKLSMAPADEPIRKHLITAKR
jgi:8-oxo-dGTP diphosphatase